MSEDERDEKLGGYIAFGFFVIGGPVALLVGYFTDIVNRSLLFGAVVSFGESACLATYWVKTYEQLFLCRILTGVSIGGASPVIFSMLGDMYPGSERVYVSSLVGIAMGAGIAGGQLLAGLVGPTLGWRVPFLMVAIPAILCALLVLFTVKEPRRGNQESAIKAIRKNKRNCSKGSADDINEYSVCTGEEHLSIGHEVVRLQPSTASIQSDTILGHEALPAGAPARSTAKAMAIKGSTSNAAYNDRAAVNLQKNQKHPYSLLPMPIGTESNAADVGSIGNPLLSPTSSSGSSSSTGGYQLESGSRSAVSSDFEHGRFPVHHSRNSGGGSSNSTSSSASIFAGSHCRYDVISGEETDGSSTGGDATLRAGPASRNRVKYIPNVKPVQGEPGAKASHQKAGGDDDDDVEDVDEDDSDVANSGDAAVSYSERIECSKIAQLFYTPSVVIVFAQGFPGCLPWGMIYVFLNDYFSSDRGVPVEVATAALTTFGIGGLFGQLVGGVWGQRLYNRDPRLQCVLMGGSTLLAVFPMLYLLNTAAVGSWFFFVMAFVAGLVVNMNGPNVRTVLQVGLMRCDTNIVPIVDCSVYYAFRD